MELRGSRPPGGFFRGEVGPDLPVFLRRELLDLPFALDDQPDDDRLDAAGGEPAPDFGPEQRAELVAHDAVEDPPRLLRVHLVVVEDRRILERLEDRVPGDLVENDAPGFLARELQHRRQVPGDGLALAVEVGREKDFVGVLGELLELRDDFAAVGDDDVVRGKVVRDVHSHLGLRQVAHVPERRAHFVLLAEVLVDGLGLGRGFDNDEFGHLLITSFRRATAITGKQARHYSNFADRMSILADRARSPAKRRRKPADIPRLTSNARLIRYDFRPPPLFGYCAEIAFGSKMERSKSRDSRFLSYPIIL